MYIENVQDINPLEVEKIEGVNYSKAWSTKRASILSKYTTGEKLTIVSSYLPGGEKSMYSPELLFKIYIFVKKILYTILYTLHLMFLLLGPYIIYEISVL